tara:strand:+ start:264 stop:464 length:201 start_codon:yes stop_codon:yes gene_type:complete
MTDIEKIDHDEFNEQINHAMLQMARYKSNIITKSELIKELDFYNDVIEIIDNHLTNKTNHLFRSKL